MEELRLQKTQIYCQFLQNVALYNLMRTRIKPSLAPTFYLFNIRTGAPGEEGLGTAYQTRLLLGRINQAPRQKVRLYLAYLGVDQTGGRIL